MKEFFRNNGILILIIAILLTAIIGVCAEILGMSPVSNLLGILSTPFRAGADAAADWMEDRYNYAFRYEELVAENEALRAQLAEAQEQLRDAEDANRQNELFRELIGLTERHKDFDLEDASVTGRSASNWEYTLTISKGTNMGVEAGDCVVDQYGNLVGVVSQVGLNWAEVAAIVDSSIEMGARLPRTDDEAVLEGDFSLMLEGRVKLAYLGALPISGDQVSTSGLGDIYPAGLAVGTVESVHMEDNGLTQYAVVRPAADLDDVRYVFVIKSFDVAQ